MKIKIKIKIKAKIKTIIIQILNHTKIKSIVII
jgi:hypothetical protein